MDAIVDEVERFLTGRTRRPRRKVLTGPDALSRREREVAVLAVRGETASEIAQRLAISERTVETHLVGIYGKLAVRSKPLEARLEGRRALTRASGLAPGRAPHALVTSAANLTWWRMRRKSAHLLNLP